ncbi:uncharacterized protein LOC128726762 [Anopheles nili]|uniref:uncharacterized protein LOC128726762 n=1 Tax=Anopheles nili TaxID=185578 RepID=UPI00237A5C5C|nr:uncharacterized protein LOC128726762 [Anopheles nili]
MASPTDNNSNSSSTCYNNNSPPLYPSTDRFHPLGYSTPQQRGNSSVQSRNYYSVQPKHMLPRARRLHKHNRSGTDFSFDHNRLQFDQESYDGKQQNMEQDRRQYERNWRGNHTRFQRFGGNSQQYHSRQRHQPRNGAYNISDYFHPSMLEDPWQFWQRQNNSSANLALNSKPTPEHFNNSDETSKSD